MSSLLVAIQVAIHVDLQPNMSKEDVIYIFNELLPLTLKMLKRSGSVCLNSFS